MSHLTKIYFLLKAVLVQVKEWFLDYWRVWPWYKRVVAIIGPIAILILAIKILPTENPVEVAVDTPKFVVLARVTDLSNKTTPVPLVGQVTSVNEATIRAESSGRLTHVYRKLGDRVVAGQVIAEFENSGERASVLQAEGAYEAAKAARDIAQINSANTSVGIGDTKTNTLNAINSSYSTMDDLVRSKTDTAFSDPRSENPKLKVLVPDSALQTRVENERMTIEKLLTARAVRNSSLSVDSDLLSEIQKVQTEAQTVKNYLDNLNSVYVKSLPDQNFSQASLDAQKAVLNAGRATIAGTLTSLSASKVALQNGLASEEIAGRTTGDSSPNAASADASVKSAQGAYLAAVSRLEKTIIRSPISGTLNSLSIETGDYVAPTSQVAVVSNNGALEVLAYVSGDDASRITIGAPVKINSNIKGIVTRIASAIDPVTKKIEVRVGILDEKAGLINGQSVRIEVSGPTTAVPALAMASQVKIPLSAVKITPRESYVFTVSASSTLQRVDIQLGTLLGDEVEIVSGLTGDMIIVKDARGLKEGQVVSVNE
jgi:RND family efflux transporter MFP subunit